MGVSPADAGTPEFDRLLMEQNGEMILWLVTLDGRLMIARAEAGGNDIFSFCTESR